jgi:hypothetical protein
MSGDTVVASHAKLTGDTYSVDVILVEYTTDDEDGDNGIKESYVINNQTAGSGTSVITATFGSSVTFNPATYKFEYKIIFTKL